MFQSFRFRRQESVPGMLPLRSAQSVDIDGSDRFGLRSEIICFKNFLGHRLAE
jgi:hypothetical protein